MFLWLLSVCQWLPIDALGPSEHMGIYRRGDEIVLESKLPLLTVIFDIVRNATYDIYVENEYYMNVTNPQMLYGIDFGPSVGKIHFFFNDTQYFHIIWNVFDRGCIQHRFTSTRSKELIEFSTNFEEPYKISEDQIFCYWPASQSYTKSYFTLEMDETGSGVLYAFGENGTCLNIFTGSNITYYYNPESDQLNFIWETRFGNLNQFFKIASYPTSTNILPQFRSMIFNKTSGVVTLMYNETNESYEKNASIWEKLFIPALVFALVSLIALFGAIFWCILSTREKKPIQDGIDLNTGSYMEASDGSSMPMPIIHI